jgi:hypothetical protein
MSVMEQDAPEQVFYLPKRLTGSGQVGSDLMAGDRRYERIKSRNLVVALTIRRHMSAITDG